MLEKSVVVNSLYELIKKQEIKMSVMAMANKQLKKDRQELLTIAVTAIVLFGLAVGYIIIN